MRIGEVARRSGISARMLRHYDALGLLHPSSHDSNGYREYTETDLRRLWHIESLRSLGLSLREIGAVLDAPDFSPATLLHELVEAAEERLRREEDLLTRLRAVAGSAPDDLPGLLRVIELLHGVTSGSASRRQSSVLNTPGDPAPPIEVLAAAVLAETEPNVAGALRWALRRHGDDAVPRLIDALDVADPGIRRRAVRALAVLAGDASTDALATALSDTDTETRTTAALTLGRRGDDRAVTVLVDMVIDGDSDVDAAEALAGLAEDPAVGSRILSGLTAQLDRAATPRDVTLRLAQAFVELLPHPAAREALQRLAGADDPTVALIAQNLLPTADPYRPR